MGSWLNSTSSAYLLVFHGSRDPRPQAAMEILVQHIAHRLECRSSMLCNSTTTPSPPLVGWAALELQPQPLHQQICQFATTAILHQIHHLQILPLFLLPGVHVQEDIPAEVELAKRQIGTQMELSILPYLGSNPHLLKGLTQILTKQAEIDAWVILAHGSRRSGGNQPIEEMTLQLQQQSHKPVLPGYWSVPPHWETQIQQLLHSGYDRIGIVPYFLFPGGITDAIAQGVSQLASQFPQTQFYLAEPIGISDDWIGQILGTQD